MNLDQHARGRGRRRKQGDETQLELSLALAHHACYREAHFSLRRLRQRIERRREAIARAGGRQPLCHRLAEQVGAAPAGQALEGRVELGDAPLRIRDQHGLAQRVQDMARHRCRRPTIDLTLGLPERQLDLLVA